MLRIIRTNIFSSINKQLWFKVSDKKCYCNSPKENYKTTLHYQDISKLYKYPKKTVMQNLHEFYDIDFGKSEKLLRHYDFVKLLPLDKLKKNCCLLKEEKVTVDRILRFIKVLSVSNLNEKVELVKQLPYSINDLFPLLMLRTNVLQRLVTEDLQHRIEFISKLIELPVLEVCKLLSKTTFHEMDLHAFEERFNLLRSYGMNVQEINKDCDVFKLEVNFLTNRLDELKKHGIKKFDSLMLCRREDIYQKKFRDKLITGGDTNKEYLTKKLKLTPEQLDSLTLRVPSVYRKDVEVIEALINILFSRGFTTEHIILCPSILVISLTKLERRLNELNNLEGRKKELYRVIANEKLYKRNFCKI